MRFRKIYQFLIQGSIPPVIAAVIFIVFRFFSFDNSEMDNLEFWCSTAMQIGIAFFLLYLNQSLIGGRYKTFFPAFLYLIFTASNDLFLYSWVNGVVTFCLFIFFILLFDVNLQSYPQGVALNIAILITLGSFIWQPLLFLFPLMWLGMFQFRCLNLRSFFAGLIGFAIIYLFILAGSVYMDDSFDIFMEKLPDFPTLFQTQILEEFDMKEYIIIGYLLFLFMLSGIHIFMADMAEKAKTRITLSFLYTITLVFFVLLILQTGMKNEWAVLLCIPLSLLVSHLFTNNYKRTNFWLLLATIVFFIGIYFVNP
ncbi:MAG: hypothetical protein LBH32_10295 [Dysgonamonadaceae bacterium]|jgi:hypothetical protein|nr:hypothetical protein [Dysgonamonadaceae bacterium]